MYKGSEYATGATGLSEGQPPVEESAFAGDTVETQEQGEAMTDYQQQTFDHGSTQRNTFYQVSSVGSKRLHHTSLLSEPVKVSLMWLAYHD